MNRYTMNNAGSGLEVHSNRRQSRIKGRMEESKTLRSMIQRQTSTLVALRRSERTAVTVAETTEESKGNSESHSGWHATFESGAANVWSDSDEASLRAPPGSDLHDSIEKIREEASRVETAIALDQLDTLKNELESLRKDLTSRDSEIKGLKQTIQVKDKRLSTLQLERDLFKADAGCDESSTSRATERISRIPLHPCTPSTEFSTADRATLYDHGSDPQQTGRTRYALSHVGPPAIIIPTSLSNSSNQVDRALQHPAQLSTSYEFPKTRASEQSTSHPYLGRPSVKTTMHPYSRLKSMDRTTPNPRALQSQEPLFLQFVPVERAAVLSLSQKPPHGQNKKTESKLWNPNPRLRSSPLNGTLQPRSMYNDEIAQSRNDAPARRQLHDVFSDASNNMSAHGLFRLHIQDDTSSDTNRVSRTSSAPSHSKKTESREQPSDTDTKTCLHVPRPLRHRRSKKKNGLKSQDVSSLENDTGSIDSFQTYAEEVSQMLETSLETSDELRKRLAMVSTYYETVVEELQKRIKSHDAQRAKLEKDLLNQIAVLQRAQKNDARNCATQRHYRDQAKAKNRMFFSSG